MISVWGKFYPSTDNAKAMQAGRLTSTSPPSTKTSTTGSAAVYNYTFYDAFNPAARQLFWEQMNTALFSKHVDAWWMDATEPDVVQPSPPTLETQKHFIGHNGAGHRLARAQRLRAR